jgi:hypothetical protein
VSPLQKFNTCGLRIKRGEEGEKVTRNIWDTVEYKFSTINETPQITGPGVSEDGSDEILHIDVIFPNCSKTKDRESILRNILIISVFS